MSRARHNAGTSLIEVLVVMVVFLVGILAVVQIFPKGFQILLLSRSASVATALSRDEIERMKARPEQLPEAIVSLNLDGSIDIGRNPFDLGLQANEILVNGDARWGGTNLGHWSRFAGANATRHVIGEGRRVPAPRQTGALGQSAFYGGLLVLQFNPVDTFTGTGIVVYGNDFNVRLGDWNPEDDRGEYDAFLIDPEGAAALRVPTGRRDRLYRVSFSAYVQESTSGPFVRRSFQGLTLPVPAGATPSLASDDPYPLYPANPTPPMLLSALLQLPVNNVGGRYNGLTLGAIDRNSVRIQRRFEEIPAGAAWNLGDGNDDGDVYRFKIMTPELGVLLFHPSGYSATVPRSDGQEPLRARVDYDVFDWRVLREEFRFPYGLPAQHRLAVGSLKVGGQTGPDNLRLVGIRNLEGSDAPDGLDDTGHARADHLVIMDLDTGGVLLERPDGDPFDSANPIVTVEKSSGLISVRDVDNDASNGTTAPVRLPDGTVLNIQIDNRALRALYMVRNEYAVQVMKAPSLYSVTYGLPGYSQFYVGNSGAPGGAPTRIYFPISDAGRKVTVGEINYRIGAGPLQQLIGQDFVIQRATVGDPVGLPYIDVTEALPFLTDAQRSTVAIDVATNGYGARDVKTASVAVRTIWNPEFFRLTTDTTQNVEQRLNTWSRGYRRSTNETYLEQGGLSR